MNSWAFDDEDLGLLREILAVQSVSSNTAEMEDLIVAKAWDFGANVQVDDRNIYVTKGQASIYPCLVAHTDTVHEIRPPEHYSVIEDGGRFSAIDPVDDTPVGIGGDDKVGIFIALYFVKHLQSVKAAFFCDEEDGCQGAKRARLEFFADAAFALECDRKGKADFVRNAGRVELHGDDFAAAVASILTSHGYAEELGGSTDVRELKLIGLSITAANMSCGYHNPHTANEYIDLDDVQRCVSLVGTIIDRLGHRQWEHDPFAQQAAD
jgi:putative aminopeptidase FrvX